MVSEGGEIWSYSSESSGAVGGGGRPSIVGHSEAYAAARESATDSWSRSAPPATSSSALYGRTPALENLESLGSGSEGTLRSAEDTWKVFAGRVDGVVREAVASHVQEGRILEYSKCEARFSVFIREHGLEAECMMEQGDDLPPKINYLALSRLEERLQLMVFIAFGAWSRQHDRSAEVELSMLRGCFALAMCDTRAFEAEAMKRARSGLRQNVESRLKTTGTHALCGITGEMMRMHIASFETRGARVAITTFLIGLAVLILYDHGKRIGTLVHTVPQKGKGGKKSKTETGSSLGRPRVYHTIPASGVHLMTEEGPAQERFTVQSYREAEKRANALGGTRRNDIKHICLYFATDKTPGGRFSMWRRTEEGLDHGSKYEDLVMNSILEACLVCDHISMDDNFLSYRNERGTMTKIVRKAVADCIKDLAEGCGLPRVIFSTHAGRHAFRTQQNRANQVRGVSSESELNVAGRNEWTLSSTVGTTVYTGPSYRDYSNLRTLEANVEGTIVSKTDTIMCLIARGISVEGEVGRTGDEELPPPISVVVVQDVDSGECTMMGVPPVEPSGLGSASEPRDMLPSHAGEDGEEGEEEEDEEEDEEECDEVLDEEGVTLGWTENIRSALETMMASGLVRDLTAPGLAGLAGATRGERRQRASTRS